MRYLTCVSIVVLVLLVPQITSTQSLGATPNVAQVGTSIRVRVTVPGGNPPEGSWVGIFKDNNYLNLFNYLGDLKATNFTRDFKVPMEAGQFEVRVLLDSGYSNVAARCTLTVR